MPANSSKISEVFTVVTVSHSLIVQIRVGQGIEWLWVCAVCADTEFLLSPPKIILF